MGNQFSSRIVFLSVLVFVFQLSLFNTARGQDSTSTATLLGWEQQIRNFMLDRSHNYGGTHFNRGLFREHLIEMSPEHNLDLITYRYTLFQDYNFEQAENAYRMSTGSLNATEFAIENTIKSDIAISEKDEISIDGYHAENIRANRFLFHLGYTRNLIGKHYLGVSHTLSQYKADLDATFFYRYGNFDDGMVKVSASILDWGSNVVQDLAEEGRNSWNERYDITHQYSNRPELLSIKYTSPQYNRLKVEILGGLQTYTRKRVEVHADTSIYIDEEWGHYLGALVEYDHPLYTVGLTYQRTFSKLKRKPTLDSNYNFKFGNWQITNQLGLYAMGRLQAFRFEQWLWYGFDRDRIKGKKVPKKIIRHGDPFDYLEEPISIKSRILYDPINSGLKTGLEFHAEYSRPQGPKAENGIRSFDFRRNYSIVRDYNARLTYTIGYRYSQHFYFLAGISYDLDGDKQTGRGTYNIIDDPTWFDGGFGRLSISW